MNIKKWILPLVAVVTVSVLSVMCFQLNQTVSVLNSENLALENENKKLLSLSKMNETSQLENNELITLQKSYQLDIEFYKTLNKSKDEIITKLYNEKTAKLNNNNPIDEFFNKQAMNAYTTSAMSSSAYLYKEAWYNELVHVYSMLNDKAHDELKPTIDQSLASIIENASCDGMIYSAVNASDAFGDEFGNISENITFGTISRSLKSMETAEILKNQTIKIQNYLIDKGENVEFIFNGNHLIQESDGPFIEENYFSKYYEIITNEDKYSILLKDASDKTIQQIASQAEPIITQISYFQIAFEVEQLNGTKKLYVYNTNTFDLSESYQNVLYFDGDNICRIENKSFLITQLSNPYRENIVIKKEWAVVENMEQAIIDIEWLDRNTVKLIYLRGNNFDQVTEFIEL